MVIIKL